MSQLKLVPLGGMGKVTQNMYLYEYENEILIFDCGIGFPDLHMPGVDVLIPDISYLLKKLDEGKKIVGMVLTHGHDDHIGATPYILPDLPEFPIFGSSLTIGFAKNRVAESEAADREMRVITDQKPVKIGTYFEIESFAVTHSVPDTKHFMIRTPEGNIYHGTDFKLDPSPVDQVVSDIEHITQMGKEGVDLMLMDCLGVEKADWVKSESTVGPAIEKEMATTKGKFIITLMSSHIHRIQQTVDAAEKHGRKIAFIGRSVEQNVEVALALNKLFIPSGMMVDKRKTNNYRDNELCLVVAGSQGQEGSSMVRAIYGDHPMIVIKQSDKVVFSASAIPGNEVPYYSSIDELFRNGVNVVYPTILHDLHQSGHGSMPEQQELLSLVKPKYVMPIGGSDRHRVLFSKNVASSQGYKENQVLIPSSGEVIGISENTAPKVVDKISIQALNVDGLGIGDVGPVVLSDRKSMSEAGIIVLVIPKRKGQLDLKNISIISRGFVFMKEADEVIKFIKDQTVGIINDVGFDAKESEIKRAIEKRLARRIIKVIKREPIILPVILNT